MIEQQPRKRSNSLPVPKMEISSVDGCEMKRKYNREFETFSDQEGSYPNEQPNFNFETRKCSSLLLTHFLIIRGQYY